MSRRQAEELYVLALDFIREQEIHCADKIYQTDHIAYSALEFLEKVCNTVGYHEFDEDE